MICYGLDSVCNTVDYYEGHVLPLNMAKMAKQTQNMSIVASIQCFFEPRLY